MNFDKSKFDHAKLYTAIDRLAQEQKVLLHLFFWENQEPSEVARQLEMSPAMVQRLLRSTLDELRVFIEHNETPILVASAA